jgi:APA family basic amino acid/polyamine antiporter
VFGFAMGLGSWDHFLPFVAQRPGSTPMPGALAGGLVAAFFSYGGWWDTAKLAGEVKEPGRTLPRALALGVAVVTLVYILTSAAFLYLVPLEGVTSGQAFAAQAGQVLFGAAGGKVFAAVVVISVLSSLAGFMMAAPRVYFAMAQDGVFPRSVAEVHPRFGTPARAIVVQAALAIALVLLGSFSQIVAYFLFATVLFIGLTVAALFVARRTPVEPGTYRTPGYPVTPVLFLLLTAVLLFLLAARNPLQAGLGMAAVALGWPVYRFAFARKA